jgi:hypothetical protein
MKKYASISVVVAIVALILSMLTGQRVESQRESLVNSKARSSRVYLPRLGIDKYLADLRWVLLVQQFGGVRTGRLSKEAAQYFANSLDELTDMDPDMQQAYDIGANFIANAAPAQAVALLDKGNEYALQKQWKWLFSAGYISERLLAQTGVDQEECNKHAERYFEKASLMSGANSYATRSWIRVATRQAGDDPVKRLLAQTDFVLDKCVSQDFGGGSEGGMNTGTESENPMVGWVLERSRNLSRGLLVQRDMQKNQAKRQELDQDLKLVRGAYKKLSTINMADSEHVCPNCLSAYGPGEFHCSNCGDSVVPFGYCQHCWKESHQLIIMKGAYCPVCGMKGESK